ncbi:hypothetical protein [Paenarthrobacter nicotinovorans]|uniref:hypothetical protein n=1 Tax=Paenarthrobacter nicotinovorans TaxID=29320 RepID=UPI003D66C86A
MTKSPSRHLETMHICCTEHWGTLESQDLLGIAADYIQAGREQEHALVAGVETADRRPAIANKWAAALTEFVDSRIQEETS